MYKQQIGSPKRHMWGLQVDVSLCASASERRLWTLGPLGSVAIPMWRDSSGTAKTCMRYHAVHEQIVGGSLVRSTAAESVLIPPECPRNSTPGSQRRRLKHRLLFFDLVGLYAVYAGMFSFVSFILSRVS